MSAGLIGATYNQTAVDQYQKLQRIQSAKESAATIQQTAITTAQKTLNSALSAQSKIQAQITEQSTVISNTSKQLNIFKTAGNTIAYNLLLPTYQSQKTKLTSLQSQLSTAVDKVTAAQKALDAVAGYSSYNAYKAAQAASGGGVGGSSLSKGKKPAVSNSSGPYVYNAPMVFDNNFRGIQSDILDPQYVLPGTYGDAKEAWTNKTPSGRGAFQMDRQTNTAEAIAIAQKNAPTNFKSDSTKYGFKFLYNPNTVQMNWGAVMAMDPVFEASGKDPIAPGTQNLTSSTIDFSLVLNRIQDFAYLNENGLKAGNTSFVNTSTLAGITAASTDPYGSFALPSGVSNRNDELKKIYEKGTMYDLEFLFKTMHGNGAYVSYESLLQEGVTSDPGWLPVRPIELHLGNKLRYRVRINSLSVSHTIFNARMVPILSTITISCVRYWDGVKGGVINP